jgi:hypothetical protein
MITWLACGTLWRGHCHRPSGQFGGFAAEAGCADPRATQERLFPRIPRRGAAETAQERRGNQGVQRRRLKLDRSKSPLIRARLGFALVASGKPGNMNRAIDELRAALQAEPDNFNAYRHLSQAYGTGDIANAELVMAEGNFRAGNTAKQGFLQRARCRNCPRARPGRSGPMTS